MNSRVVPKGPDARQSICLVTALTVADFIDPDLIAGAHTDTGAQLGVLTLAALLREQGFNPSVVNLDDLFFEFIGRDTKRAPLKPDGNASQATNVETPLSEFFFSFVVRHLGPASFDVFGFSSICSSYPLTLRLAAQARRTNANTTIVLGGPQASVVDIATMHAFPCIDLIVRGEADDTFPALMKLLETGDSRWQSLSGITFRRGEDVIRNPNARVVENLDRLPMPAFELDASIRARKGIHLEAGRGCPFVCTFCSTNDFFRRNFRLKSSHTLIEQISALKKEYGIDYFSLVHDMYTVDRKKVVEFCDAISASGEKFTWGCSARTDCIDDDLLGLMASAGCAGIFFGIETGSQRLQKVINKNLDLDETIRRIECADRNGIRTTVALIVGFPEETRDDLRDTLHFFIDALRFEHVEPQCSLLAPLAATPIYEQHKDELIFDRIFSDISNQNWRLDPVEQEMIREHPAVFPNFYAIPTVLLDRQYVKEVTDFATYLATWFRWLPVAILQDSADLLNVFDRWQRWRLERPPRVDDEDTTWTPYYSHRRFHREFLEFVRTCYVPEMANAPAAIVAVLEAESVHSRDALVPIVDAADTFQDNIFPYRLPELCVAQFDVDYNELIDSLKKKRDLTSLSSGSSTVVFSPQNDRLDIWQLPPLSAMLLTLCNGTHTVRDIVRDFSRLATEFDGVPAEKVCLFGLMQLKDDGFIGLSASPVKWQAQRDGKAMALEPRYALPPQANNTQQPWPPLPSKGKQAIA